MAVADNGGAVAPLVAVVGHGHDDVVDDHHFVPGYKQGPDLIYKKSNINIKYKKSNIKIKYKKSKWELECKMLNGNWDWEWKWKWEWE